MPMTKLERKLIYPLSIYSQNDFDHAVPVEKQHAVSQDAITIAKRMLVVYRFIVSLLIALVDFYGWRVLVVTESGGRQSILVSAEVILLEA